MLIAPHSESDRVLLREEFDYYGLESVTLEDQVVVATFGSPLVAESAARQLADDGPAVASGPFRLESVGERARLEARDDDVEVDAIEIRSLSTNQLWRQLHGGSIDVIPMLDELHRDRFLDMQSVRTLDLPISGYAAVVFLDESGWFSDPDNRSRFAGLIDREAVARVACGRADCAVEDDVWAFHERTRGRGSTAGELEWPGEVDLGVFEADSSMVLGANVLEHQLRAEGIQVEVTSTSSDEIRTGNHSEGILLVPLASSPAGSGDILVRLGILDEGDRAAGSSGAEEEDYWRERFATEIPAVPLYEGRHFAAVDDRLCGGDPDRASSWEWLADLRPCDDED